MSVTQAGRIHYWTGYGTLCSLDNSVTQQPNHSSDHTKVTCGFCHHLMMINRRNRAPDKAGAAHGA